ncbi:DUF1289 domain-containing protein [Pseudohongiella spirulinae]|uniref:Fe-S protein n=1 Tax=Pseudohongiella spirulinae TaxID=1249552 RepID=A0A0S2KER6_9GAMM|nr:DUF1289 domain-containing protein [Pseudohongiella spirulinae]ALO46532.1 Fe-S protein [Pseudohongiella spirulinae]
MADDFSVKWLKFPVDSLCDHFLMTVPPVRTPCIGICSTTSVGDAICRGCKRFAFEVIEWNSFDDQEKQAVVDRLEQLIRPIVETRFIIRSADTLASGLRRQGVPFNPALSPTSWLHNLLKKRHQVIRDLSEFGVEVRPDFSHLSLAELAEDMDVQLLRLCQAHQLRYFPELG